ncbi:uncharacterized protein LOC6580742 [Drosophila mojavensis]|uniref:Uncharacterized protein n=1 Tax=Drosophila mojavensis TaxID=7230 RepID=B4KS44_DROMO|nr:uncharacterized protein LOC6580742 [Drosophila mojavensis]EDW10480.1 uncharacterized protein Dmoj_GI18516 [Drosophila mojavensis]
MLKSVRAVPSPLLPQGRAKCWWLIRCAMRCTPPNREVSYMSYRRQGWRPSLMLWLSGLRSRYCMWKLRRALGPDFDEFDFLMGVRQAASLMIEAVRLANWSRIRSCCTDQGACAIYGLTQSQRNLQYTKLVRFESQHLCQVVPISVQRLVEQGRNYVYANIVFVGLRDLCDFASSGEQQEMLQQIRDVLQESQIPEPIAPTHRRIVLGEFLLTLRKELADPKGDDDEPKDWLVDSYNIFGVKLVNYSPVTLQYRIIEFLKPV